MRHFNIPIFISHYGCPHTCVFCNQVKINGRDTDISGNDVREIIDQHLEFLPKEGVKEVAFFGGTFTGIPVEIQELYLKEVSPYIKKGLVDGIRLSTRPDYINQEKLDFLKKYGVTTIELGVQSLEDKVLNLSERGYSLESVIEGVKLIKENNFKLGIQLMPGLPGSTKESDIRGAKTTIELKPDMVRIYPTLVINDTKLEEMFHSGEFSPLKLEESIERVLPMLALIELARINIIRVGLQPSDDLRGEGVIKAGPFHPAYKELVESEIYKRFLEKIIKERKLDKKIVIFSNEKNISKIIGMKRSNAIYFKDKLDIKIEKKLPKEEIIVEEERYSREDILRKVLGGE